MQNISNIKENKKELPRYTKGEEIFNAVTHIVGAGFGIAFLVLGVTFASLYNDEYAIISMVIYGICMILLYVSSSIYHFLKPNKAKKLFRVFDHCTIFLLIAGTYTPFCLIALRGEGAWGWVLFAILWFLAICGIIAKSINIHSKIVAKIGMFAYLAMGWCGVAAIFPLLRVVPVAGLILTLAGGISYTVGAIFYGCGHKKKYIHSVWHLFVLAGTILQFFAILFYIVL